MSDLLDVNETAAYLTVHRATVYRLVKDGRLTIVKVRGGTRFRRSDLDRYLRANERTTACCGRVGVRSIARPDISGVRAP